MQTFEPRSFVSFGSCTLFTRMVKLAPCWVALAAASATVAVTSALPLMAPSKTPTGLLVDFQKSPGQGIRLTPDFSCEFGGILCLSCTLSNFDPFVCAHIIACGRAICVACTAVLNSASVLFWSHTIMLVRESIALHSRPTRGCTVKNPFGLNFSPQSCQ